MALIFAEVFKRARPKVRIVTLAETLGAVNKAGLAETYKRLFFQIWDSRDGTIAWEGTQEMQYSQDTIKENPVTFRTVIARTASDLTARLP